ncbi:hypothetical protein [Paenibacillus senegalensis]|uniref:hypothetical protein n=1 Tax=Paenibacillus senegalensis TaxID=1465766 RepID=UPI000289CC76|nr:hypothetical protein [Paenibacillus senegalensis]
MRKYFIIILLVVNIGAVSILIYQHHRLNEVISDMGFRMVSSNLVQLEGAIMYQMQNNWSEPDHVIEKVEDVIEGLDMTRRAADRVNKLSKEDNEVLSRLIRYFETFPAYSGFPNHSMDEEEITAFEKLRENLREAGWGMNMSYTSGWNELIEKAYKLTGRQ